MKKRKDRYGRYWKLPKKELCPVCGQPDNCGDCNHKRLLNEQVIDLGGALKMTKKSNCNGCGKFINVDKAKMKVLKDGNIELYCQECKDFLFSEREDSEGERSIQRNLDEY